MKTAIEKKIKSVAGKIASLIKLAYVTVPDDDTGLDAGCQFESLGKPLNAALYSPYGLSSNLPEGATLVLLANNGSSESNVGYGSFPENRFRSLKVWEVQIGNYKTKANILFRDDGVVVINEGNEPAVKGDTFKENYDYHQHPTAFGLSGVPAVSLDQSNFNPDVLV